MDPPSLWKSVIERSDAFVVSLNLILSPELCASHARWGPAREKPRSRRLREAESPVKERAVVFRKNLILSHWLSNFDVALGAFYCHKILLVSRGSKRCCSEAYVLKRGT